MPTYRVKVRRTAKIVLEREFSREEAGSAEQAATVALDVSETEGPWELGWYEPDGYGMNMEWTDEPKIVIVEEVE